MGVPDLQRSISLPVKRTLCIPVLGHLEPRYIVWPGRGSSSSSSLILTQLRLCHAATLCCFNLGLGFRPLKLKCLALHLPFGSGPRLDQSFELSFRIVFFWCICVDIGLFNMFKARGGVTEHRSIAVVFAVVEILGP